MNIPDFVSVIIYLLQGHFLIFNMKLHTSNSLQHMQGSK